MHYYVMYSIGCVGLTVQLVNYFGNVFARKWSHL